MDKKQFIMNNANILNKKINELRIKQLEEDVLESEFVFDKSYNDCVLLIKDLTNSFYIGLDSKKGFVKIKKNKKTIVKNIKTIKTTIKNIDEKIVNRINLIYDAFIDDESIPVSVSNYNEYFKALNENIQNNEPRIINTNELKPNSRLSGTIGLKKSGEPFGLGAYSSITLNSSISMDIDVEQVKEFEEFAFNINNRALKFMERKMKIEYRNKIQNKKEVTIQNNNELKTSNKLINEEVGIEELTNPKM